MLHRWLYLVLYLALIVHSNAFADQAEYGEAKIIQHSSSRDFGVLVGDQIKHHYIIEVPEKFSLSLSSLPAKGDINYWLKIVSVKYDVLAVKNNYKRYQLDIVFQTFYAPLDVRVLYIPAMPISFYHADREINITLPKWSFIMSPLKESSAAGGEARSFMKPDLAVKAIDTKALKLQIYALALLVLLMSLVWLMLTGRLFNTVRSPFQQAAKQIRVLQRNLDETHIEQAFNAVHQAFNQQAGHAVFSHQIDVFTTNFPEFNSNKKQITDFYQLSIDVLYGQKQACTDHMQQLLDLCRVMAKSEKLALKK
jgi:mxaA protein